jgi:hypothetical protein
MGSVRFQKGVVIPMSDNIDCRVPEDIVEQVKRARDTRISHEDEHANRPGELVINATCARNSWRLAYELLREDYESYIVWGAVAKTPGHNLPLETIDQLEASKRVHFWVELAPDTVPDTDVTEPVILEVSSESFKHKNSLLVGVGRPERYRVMEEMPSHIRYERSFRAGDLMSKGGYRRLRDRSPELFEMNPWTDNEQSTHPEAGMEANA